MPFVNNHRFLWFKNETDIYLNDHLYQEDTTEYVTCHIQDQSLLKGRVGLFFNLHYYYYI